MSLMSSRRNALSMPTPSLDTISNNGYLTSLELLNRTTAMPSSPTSSASSENDDFTDYSMSSSASIASSSDQSRRSSLGSDMSIISNKGIYQIETLLALASSPLSQAMTEANATSESVKALHDFVKSSRRRRGNGRKSKKSDKNKSDTDTKSQKKVEDGMNNVQVSAMQIKPPSSKTVTKAWITKSASQIDSMTSWRM